MLPHLECFLLLFYTDCGHPNSGPYAHIESTLLIEPSLQPQVKALNYLNLLILRHQQSNKSECSNPGRLFLCCRENFLSASCLSMGVSHPHPPTLSHTDSCNLSPHLWALGPPSGHSQSTPFLYSPLPVIKQRIGRSQYNPELWTNSRPRDLAENGCGSSHGSWGWGLHLFLFKSLLRLLPSTFSLMQTLLIPGYCL